MYATRRSLCPTLSRHYLAFVRAPSDPQAARTARPEKLSILYAFALVYRTVTALRSAVTTGVINHPVCVVRRLINQISVDEISGAAVPRALGFDQCQSSGYAINPAGSAGNSGKGYVPSYKPGRNVRLICRTTGG